MNKSPEILAFNSMLLTHFLHDEISESLRYQLKLVEEETDEAKLNWKRLSSIWLNMFEGYRWDFQELLETQKAFLNAEVKPNYPLIYDLIMLDIFG